MLEQTAIRPVQCWSRRCWSRRSHTEIVAAERSSGSRFVFNYSHVAEGHSGDAAIPASIRAGSSPGDIATDAAQSPFDSVDRRGD